MATKSTTNMGTGIWPGDAARIIDLRSRLATRLGGERPFARLQTELLEPIITRLCADPELTMIAHRNSMDRFSLPAANALEGWLIDAVDDDHPQANELLGASRMDLTRYCAFLAHARIVGVRTDA